MSQSQAELVKALIEAGVHFGHRVSRWNPKMEPYISGRRKTIHIINLKETLKGILRAKKYVSQIVSRGKDVLFVGTKRQAREAIEAEAKRCGMHYVTERWLGGTLTNYSTIRSRLARLEELENLWATGNIETYSKKMKATLTRELRKIRKNLEGIRRMTSLPGAVFVVDVRREHIAVREARKLGITTIAIIDTDGDPDLIDLPIPANDDAMRVIELIVHEIADAVIEGKAMQPEKGEEQSAAPGGAPGPVRRRSARAMFRAEESPDAAQPAQEAAPAEGAASLPEPLPGTQAAPDAQPVSPSASQPASAP